MHRARLVEGADQVFTRRMIDARFSADRTVDLREQRRGHVHQRDAAEVGGRGIAGQRADDACDLVERFLDTASLASVDRVRIVHGHGMGILKRAIHDLLRSSPHVARFYEAQQFEGGSGATIVGALLLGVTREAATEFSFFLAVPTLVAAGGYDLWKNRALFSADDLGMFGVGLASAFASVCRAKPHAGVTIDC